MSRPVWIDERIGSERDAAMLLRAALTDRGIRLIEASSGKEACGLVLFDALTDELVETIRELSANGRHRVVAVALSEQQVTGAMAWPLRRAGACDVLCAHNPALAASAIESRAARWASIDELISSDVVSNGLIGQSPVWLQTLRLIVEAAVFTDGSFLLLGESGTGKELIARMVHALDRRPGKKSLVVLDCTTVAPELAGSEFFGHERGAFTGATALREGSFALADGGTLFLDEVGELPLSMQAQLLRVVQESTYKRVGGNDWLRARFRLIAATNRKLDQEVEQGSFRRDLFHRLASGVYRIPALRERTEDILPLAQHFIAQAYGGGRAVALDLAVREYLVNRAYPGNVRELRQLVRRMAERHVGDGPLTIGALPPDELDNTDVSTWKGADLDRVIWKALESGAGLAEIKDVASARAFDLALRMEAGSTRAAAQRLAVTERTVQMYRADARRAPASIKPSAA